MAQYVTLRGHRNRDQSFRIEHIQKIADLGSEGKSQMFLLSNPQPEEVSHTRKEVLGLIHGASLAQTEDA